MGHSDRTGGTEAGNFAVKFIGMGRTRRVAGNWKMHGSRRSNRELLEGLVAAVPQVRGVECTVCVPFPYLGEVAAML